MYADARAGGGGETRKESTKCGAVSMAMRPERPRATRGCAHGRADAGVGGGREGVVRRSLGAGDLTCTARSICRGHGAARYVEVRDGDTRGACRAGGVA